ncbi:MAG: 4-hydroxy-tetrahydrodipicolinate reductase [Xanthomonadaceae bacterium]|nr:4-hydroxy-tetrahydrodipicolinate reductase [Xanthomonadaceae bacterium]MDP2186943.1 4-hydroxy-tetrahydrodipicolinate reductase [Xanthomonadales bacterium]MDZ4116267.1 4-hydroxy-tetrahydrodipicolinate reductase [Xanthomonadaceae bacterium]MDZ4377686.1 4-hydroxy-tetrahydrodipicolinate reductase [Xanthomonadaceae bacterium]
MTSPVPIRLPIRLLIHGASGRMGQALIRLAAQSPDLCVVAAVSRQQTSAQNVPWVASSALAEVPPFDVAIDFSLPSGVPGIVELCRSRGAALVCGTTGLDDSQRALLADAANAIAVLWAANFSIGIAVLSELVRQAAAALPGWDCDVIEAHHTRKLDAPSGTALALGAAAAEGRGSDPHYCSIRAGDIVGEHTVMLTAAGERLELVHRASNRDVFALGALHAARRLAVAPAGNHDLASLLFARL